MIRERYTVPTGDILVVDGEYGPLECLSLGDYGKGVNLVERPVVHTDLLPLEQKWVITISSQYGCSMGCHFCDVPKVGPGRNATLADLHEQVHRAMSLHPEVAHTDRLNIHYARMGEPTFNQNVLEHARDWSHGFGFVHPVVSTMMPRRNRQLAEFLREWVRIKNSDYLGNAGLQLSINSTDDEERAEMFSSNALELDGISLIMSTLPRPVGRKYTLNFAVADYTIDAGRLRELFNPEDFIVKLTPMHRTAAAIANCIETDGEYTTQYPYKHHAEALRAAGFEVLVFIASAEEDASRITCGNAILSGTQPKCDTLTE